MVEMVKTSGWMEECRVRRAVEVETAMSEVERTDNSQWMTSLPEKVRREVPLMDLAIPGSHDSFTSNLTRTGRAGADQPAWLRRLTGLAPCFFSHILYRWSITQDLSLTDQLAAGVRYFDIRLVALRGTFRVLHCLLGDKISEVLQTLSRWLEEHREEVVILDFQHLYKFTREDHLGLIEMVLTQFAGRLCSWRQDLKMLTLQHLAVTGSQVIIIYPPAAGNNHYLWPRSLCPSPWPDTMSVPHLLESLTLQLKHHHARAEASLFVSQAVLTPSWRTPVLHPLSSVKTQCADRCGQEVTRWVEQESLSLNIVIMDYVTPHNTNIVINKNYKHKV